MVAITTNAVLMFGRNNEKALSKGDNMMNVKKPDDILAGSIVSQTAYGENGWQSPAYHLIDVNAGPDPLALHRFKLRAGTPSFNNFCDLDRLLQTMIHLAAAFEINRGRVPQIALAVKHGNACGAGCSDRPNSALSKMIAGDTRAIMGGLVMTNFPLDAQLADHLLTYLHPAVTGSKNGRRLLDGIIAPEITDDAIELMKRKKDKCRIFTNPSLASLGADSLDQAPLRRQVRGGYLLQPNYCFVAKLSEAVPLVPDQHGLPADPEIWENLLMAWAIAATQTSNTITIVNKRMLIGNGVGQQDRVGAARLAIERARMSGHQGLLEKACAASDSFFPFPDGVETLAAAGIKTILATSGSVSDRGVGERAAELGITLVAHPDKVARGFFNH